MILNKARFLMFFYLFLFSLNINKRFFYIFFNFLHKKNPLLTGVSTFFCRKCALFGFALDIKQLKVMILYLILY